MSNCIYFLVSSRVISRIMYSRQVTFRVLHHPVWVIIMTGSHARTLKNTQSSLLCAQVWKFYVNTNTDSMFTSNTVCHLKRRVLGADNRSRRISNCMYDLSRPKTSHLTLSPGVWVLVMITSTAITSGHPLHTSHSNHWAFTLKEPWDGLLD